MCGETKNRLFEYLPECGEGENIANQVATAINKIIFKWYNDGDVYDNRYYLKGWYNNISSYANWLYFEYNNAEFNELLDSIKVCKTESDYDELICKIEVFANKIDYESLTKKEKIDSVYTYNKNIRFKFVK